MTKYQVDWFKWNIKLQDSTFRVYAVQPEKLELKNSDEIDGNIFNNTIDSFWGLKQELINNKIEPDVQEASNISDKPKQFNLITFPEIFLPANYLITFLKKYKASKNNFSCIHTGLRPSREIHQDNIIDEQPEIPQDFLNKKGLSESFKSSNDESFLFSKKQVELLLDELKNFCNLDDIKVFEDWFKIKYEDSSEDKRLNLACFMTKDSSDDIRICIHPKVVRSKYEFFGSDEENMLEADCLQIISLIPVNQHSQINILPLTCSDLLFKPWDYDYLPHPLEGLIRDKDINKVPVETIDIISVSACTPISKRNNDIIYGENTWKKEFRDIFSKAVLGDFYSKFKLTYFVLSNYLIIKNSEKSEAGLSGFFVPTENYLFKDYEFNYLHIEVFSRPENSKRKQLCIELGATNEEGWISLKYLKNNFVLKDDYLKAKGKVYGSLISLNSKSPNPIVSIIMIKFQGMLKNFNLSNTPPLLSDKSIYEGNVVNEEFIWRKVF